MGLWHIGSVIDMTLLLDFRLFNRRRLERPPAYDSRTLAHACFLHVIHFLAFSTHIKNQNNNHNHNHNNASLQQSQSKSRVQEVLRAIRGASVARENCFLLACVCLPRGRFGRDHDRVAPREAETRQG